MSQSCAIVIPARMASTRFPGKPLVDLCGRPMIQWVVEAAVASQVTDTILVATPDDEIVAACKAFGARAVKTRDDHPSGTDRIAEVAESLDVEVLVNVQGDEPLIDPATIRACAEPLLADSSLPMGSIFQWAEPHEIEDPSVVKVVTDLAGNALYFSRYPVPFPRNQREVGVKRHIGIYAYRSEIVRQFSGWSPSPLELTESLEQLRFMENGVKIRMSEGKGSRVSVDTPEQAEEVRKILAKEAKN